MADDRERGDAYARRMLIMQIVGIPIGMAFGLYIYFSQHTAFGLVIAALVPVFAFINVSLMRGSRSRLTDPSARTGELTGQTLSPPPAKWAPPSPYELQSPATAPMPTATRWVGAGDVPGGLGRTNASTPLAVLELNGDTLTFRIRPRLLAKMFGIQALVVSPSDVESIYPAKGRLRTPGICVRPRQRAPYYFLSVGGDRSAILTVLAAAGFPVEWDERKYSFS